MIRLLMLLLSFVMTRWASSLNFCSRNADCPVNGTACLLSSTGLCFCQPHTANQAKCPYTYETDNGRYPNATNLQNDPYKSNLFGPILALNQSKNDSSDKAEPKRLFCERDEDCTWTDERCLKLPSGCTCKRSAWFSEYPRCRASRWKCERDEDCTWADEKCLKVDRRCECMDEFFYKDPYPECARKRRPEKERSGGGGDSWVSLVIVGVFFFIFIVIVVAIIVLFIILSRRRRARRLAAYE